MRTCWVTMDAIPGVVVTVSVATADSRIVAEIERAAELNGISLERRRSEPSPLEAFAAGWTGARGSDRRREELLAPLYLEWVETLREGPREEPETLGRAAEGDGLVWALTRLREWGDNGVETAITTTDTWILVHPLGSRDARYAVLRSTGAVYTVSPDGSVSDDPIFTPA